MIFIICSLKLLVMYELPLIYEYLYVYIYMSDPRAEGFQADLRSNRINSGSNLDTIYPVGFTFFTEILRFIRYLNSITTMPVDCVRTLHTRLVVGTKP